MLKDRLTTRVLGLVLLVFPAIMGGSTLVLTNPTLRTNKLLIGVLVLILPLWAAGAYLLVRGQRMPEDED